MPHTNTSEWPTIVAVASITLQLLRVSIDLVLVAGKPTPSSSSSPETSAAATATYGSVQSTQQTESNNDISEDQPLLVGRASTSRATTRTVWRMRFLTVVWTLLFITFAFATTANLIPRALPVASCLVLAMEIILLYRDPDKERVGSVVRFLQQWTLVILLFGYVRFSTILNGLTSSSKQTLLLVTLAVIHLVLGLVDGFIVIKPTRQPPTAQPSDEKPGLSRKAILTLLKPYFWPDATSSSATANRLRAIATWLCVIASKVCNVIAPLYLGWASTALAHQDYSLTVRYSVTYAVISWFSGTFKEGQSLVYLKVAQAAYIQLASTSFRHLHSLSLDWHLRKKLGVVLRSVNRGIAACDTLMKYLFLWLVPALIECLTVCVIFATLFSYLPLAISVFYFVFAYVLWTILVTLWRKKFRKALVKSDNEMEDRFVDSMINFETVKYFTAEDFEAKRFADAVQTYQAGTLQVQASLSVLNISQQVILKTCLATALALSAAGIRQRIDCCVDELGCDSGISDCCQSATNAECPGMQVGDFVTVLTYTVQLFTPLNFLGTVYNAVVMSVIDLASMSELLAESPDVTDDPNAMTLPRHNMTGNADVAVEFDNVFFHYPTQPVNSGLRGLSFTMKRGTTTAIVGPTGAGKTTVSRLLFRFYDALSGSVRVNGVDVRSVTQRSLRESIGVVPQAASMFNDTLRRNLLYGKRDATEDELRQAAADSQLLGFVESLDDGWETIVGDRGLKLSGGEKQRAAICRCLLKNPDFVLLDEATSALDTLTEKSVQDALDRLGADRTVLVIAHRLGTIRHADNIVVLKDGVAAEQGTHDELLARGGIYADMWNMQLHSTSTSNSQVNLVDEN